MISSWRDPILAEFTPQVARLTLVADPDGLLWEEKLLQAIHARGFELIRFTDHVAFRFAYESRYRRRWDRGESTDLVVVLHSPSATLDDLPYDLLQAGRQLAFDLGELFPQLSYPVVAALDRGHLDQLHQAQCQNRPDSLGDLATIDFILAHVFTIVPQLVHQPGDLLRILLHHHAKEQTLPAILAQRVIDVVQRRPAFVNWPLAKILPDRSAFLAFLQQHWPRFLDRLAGVEPETVREQSNNYFGANAGPVDMPFAHDEVRGYICRLFRDGLLTPVAHRHGDQLREEWVAVGIVSTDYDQLRRRCRELTNYLATTLPDPQAGYREWIAFAWRWAELTALRCRNPEPVPTVTEPDIAELRHRLDRCFARWCRQRYAGLANQPPLPPVMVHHIPGWLARQRDAGHGQRIALIVVDGLALDHWLVIRRWLRRNRPHWRWQENAVYAWLPTLTSLSRQALFAGQAPLYFSTSISGTSREPAWWNRFWGDQGLAPAQIGYAKNLGEGNLDELVTMLADPGLQVVGLVIDKLDKIMHGIELGAAGMHNQIEQWLATGYFGRLIDMVAGQGFKIWLASDHGSIEAEGCGCPDEGMIADIRGVRVRIYPSHTLRHQVKQRFPGAIAWPPFGLPDGWYPLLAPPRSAFVKPGQRVVTHGGLSLEEVVVPFIAMENPTHG